MCEQLVSKAAVVATVLWVTVTGLIAASWAVILTDPESWRLGGLLGVTACALSAGAATWHVKLYSIRVVNLIRATSGLDGEAGTLRPLR